MIHTSQKFSLKIPVLTLISADASELPKHGAAFGQDAVAVLTGSNVTSHYFEVVTDWNMPVEVLSRMRQYGHIAYGEVWVYGNVLTDCVICVVQLAQEIGITMTSRVEGDSELKQFLDDHNIMVAEERAHAN